MENENALYCTVNKGQVYVPSEIKNKSIIIDDDIGYVITQLIK